MKLRWLLLFLFTLLLPHQSFAFQEWILDPSNPSFYQAILAIVNFSVAVVAFGFIAPLYTKLSGLLKRAWLFLIIASSILLALLLLALLRGFSIVDLSFLFGIAQLAMLFVMLAGVLTFKRFIHEVIAKKLSRKERANN